MAFAAVAAFGLTACGGGSGGGSSSQSAEGTLTVAFDADAAPTGYDPLLYSQGQFTFFSSMYDALWETDTDGVSQPSLATGYTNSADNLQTTITLRDDVTFTDGSSLDADLVKANLERRTDADLTAYGAFAAGGASEITDVAVTDPQTVVVTWAAPQATPENTLVDTQGTIVGPDGVADPDTLETTPDGSGPYTLDADASTRASSYTVTKNADNWDADSWSYDTIVFTVITDAQALANAVVSGQADVATILDPSTIDLVESRQKTVSVGGTIVGFPVTDKTGAINPAFGSVEVRQALIYATDRQALVDDLHPVPAPPRSCSPRAPRASTPASTPSTPTTRTRPASCWPTPATRTASRST
ncbi:ABC transporter substrate-binding protein [Klenkia terrae]|uniref:ABC transporter substrate-binding protein n=1 Tax=Klenkia terrae TaxID=1052259 RepID=UPI003610E8E2